MVARPKTIDSSRRGKTPKTLHPKPSILNIEPGILKPASSTLRADPAPCNTKR